MIELELTKAYGFGPALRGMRNPLNSWEKGDSYDWCFPGESGSLLIGPNDKDLAMRLRKAGTEHRKYLRMIAVWVDITAPLYWWKEFDTYKVGTVANSCSTMHTIHKTEITSKMFSTEHICSMEGRRAFMSTVNAMERMRVAFLETKDKKYWDELIQLMPESFNQKRTVMLNYEVLANIYRQRKDHKLGEWHEVCAWIEGLPYSELITGIEKEPDFSEEVVL